MSIFHLAAPFLTDDLMFAYGVEFGMIYERYKDTRPQKIEEMIHADNEDRVLLLFDRWGYEISSRESIEGKWKIIKAKRREE